MENILEINGISKKYTLTDTPNSFFTIGDFMKGLFKSKSPGKEFYAVQDITFALKKGETLGIIGRNGAGKSTLLKIISKITSPTAGKIFAGGRIASLLEVGTGFHPELTGRENIFLNGSILGMSKTEINEKLNDIIDFSGVEKFIDTPLKHYSSGMQLRLAFAVASFLDPEILIIDEVLAVGDAEFQKKCISKMKEVSSSGKTIIFVSHNLSVLKTLCSKSLLLEEGKMTMFDDTEKVIEHYQQRSMQFNKRMISGSLEMSLKAFSMLDGNGMEITGFNYGDGLTFQMNYDSIAELDKVTFAICFDNIHQQRVTSIWTAFGNSLFDIRKGMNVIEMNVPKIRLMPGTYQVIIYCERSGKVIERIDDFMTVVVGMDTDKQAFVPSASQGNYLEDFEVKMK